MSVPSRGEVADCAQLNAPRFTIPLVPVASKKEKKKKKAKEPHQCQCAFWHSGLLQKDSALHRGTTCLFIDIKGLIRGNEDAIFHFYLTQWTFKINRPVNVKTAPNWSLVDTRLLFKPKDDQHKQWHRDDNSVRAGIWKFFLMTMVTAYARWVCKND